MALDKLIYSYTKNPKKEETILSTSPTSFVGIGLETYNNEYYIDYGDGDVFKINTSEELIYDSFSLLENVKIITNKNNIKSIVTNTSTFNFNSDVFVGMNRLKSLNINAGVTIKINQIPKSINSFTIRGVNSQIDGGYNGYSFIEPLQVFSLRNEVGVGLTSSEVDALLGDLSKANWVGLKRLNILGINQPRTTASDSFYATLKGKGVLVNTNIEEQVK